MAGPTIGISIRLTPEERDAFREAAAREDRPMQWVMRRLIRDYIAQSAPVDPGPPPKEPR
jgi:predicted transcriptional regulator